MEYNLVWYRIGVETAITPKEPLPPLPNGVGPNSILVCEGRAPIWRYGMAFHKAHGSFSAIGVWEPKMRTVIIVASHIVGLADGDQIAVATDQVPN